MGLLVDLRSWAELKRTQYTDELLSLDYENIVMASNQTIARAANLRAKLIKMDQMIDRVQSTSLRIEHYCHAPHLSIDSDYRKEIM